MGNAFSEFFLTLERNHSGYTWKRGCLKTKSDVLPVVNPTQGFSQHPFVLVRKALGRLWYALQLKRAKARFLREANAAFTFSCVG